MKIKNVKWLDWYKLYLEYEDWIKWQIDLSDFVQKWIFNRLLKWDNFKNVKVNKFWNSIQWDNELDIDWDNCYYEITWKNPFIEN
jgi:hypothetical protein